MNSELVLAVLPTIFLSVCSGVMFIGTILYFYVYSYTKKKLYSSIAALGLLGALYISFEAIVIASGILGNPSLGFTFHRLQALSASCFLWGLPLFIIHLVDPVKARSIILKILGYSGMFLCIVFIAAAFISPDLFLSNTHPNNAVIHIWNIGRGYPGILYKIRDMLIAVWAISCVVVIASDVFKAKPSLHIVLSFVGATIAIGSGILDLYLAARERTTGLFSIRTFSMFSIGMTIFILLSMIGVMKFFVDQTRGIEKAMKLQSLGTLAGGIAHDFNNILTSIVGNISMINQDLSADNEYAQIFSEIEMAAYKARDLTEQLLTFSKGGEPVRKLTSTTGLINQTANFILVGTGIDLKVDMPDMIWNINADPGQISQVIQNVIINAKQALDNKGVIHISGENIAAYVTPDGITREESFVKLVIRDNGPGIPGRIIKRIFDPYFTTKADGSGLGLFICYSIIKHHNGFIDVKSEPGQGTSFEIYLPASMEKIEVSMEPEIIQDSREYSALILEDDKGIQRVLEKMLARLNVDVVVSSTGEETLQLYKENMAQGRNFDIILLDLTIVGGMGGRETAVELLRLDPNTRIIASSGYSTDPVMSDYRQFGFSGIIRKPYRFQEFEQTIRQVLHSRE